MNHAGEIRTLVGIAEPDIRVWTNVGDAHLGFFASADAIADAKGEILERQPARRASSRTPTIRGSCPAWPVFRAGSRPSASTSRRMWKRARCRRWGSTAWPRRFERPSARASAHAAARHRQPGQRSRCDGGGGQHGRVAGRHRLGGGDARAGGTSRRAPAASRRRDAGRRFVQLEPGRADASPGDDWRRDRQRPQGRGARRDAGARRAQPAAARGVRPRRRGGWTELAGHGRRRASQGDG